MSVLKIQKRDASTGKMLDAALVEFSNKGFAGARIASIAEAAGVSKGLLSQRFGSKEEMFLEIIKKKLSVYDPVSKTDRQFPNVLRYITKTLKVFAAVKDDMYKLISICINTEFIPESCSAYIKEWFVDIGVYESMKNDPQINETDKDRLFVRFCSYIKMILGITMSFIEGGFALPTEDDYLHFLGYGREEQTKTDEYKIIKENIEPHDTFVSSAFENYEFVCFVYLNGKDIAGYKTTHEIQSKIDAMDSSLSKYERFVGFFQSYIHPDDIVEFSKAVSTITENAKNDVESNIVIKFRAIENGTEKLMTAKFTVCRKMPGGVMFGVSSMDEYAMLEHKYSIAAAEDRKRKAESLKVISELTDDYEGIIYVNFTPNPLDDDCILYRIDQDFTKAIPGWSDELSFHNRLEKMYETIVHPSDRKRFYNETRRQVIIDNMLSGSAYYVEFRTFINGQVGNYQMKFISDIDENGIARGFTVGLHNIDKENNRTRLDKKNTDIIGILSNEYTAVYYIDAKTGFYDIVFQLGHVKKSVNGMLSQHTNYVDAFLNYVEMMVHPDDKKMMRREVTLITEHLKTAKSYKVEFRRNYSGKYLYTEMKCVKSGNAEDELTSFVVGFAENDAEYRAVYEQQQLLETAVLERSSELQERNLALNRVNEEIIELLGNVTEARDADSGMHIRRVKGITNIIAKQIMKDWPEYAITNDMIELLTSASALHDIGKIMIPDAILFKPGKLTPEEFEIMKTHCEKGCDILRMAPIDWSEDYKKVSYDVIRYHHEKYDGRGYPLGLKGDEIPITAQIVSIADCFDALTTKRVYKDAIGREEAFNMILNGDCGAFSDKIISSFIAVKKELFEHIEAVSQHAITASPSVLRNGSLSWARFLYIDENELNRKINAEILESEGALVHTAKNAQDGINAFSSSDSGFYDVILMSSAMKDNDGLRATMTIRELDRVDSKTIPIIGLSSHTTENDINRCLASGMDSAMTNPISIAKLNKILFECIQKHNERLDEAVKKANSTALEHLDDALHLADSSGFINEYDFVCYVNGNTNDVSSYKANKAFERIMRSISPRLPSNKRLDQMFKRIVPPKYFSNFLEDVNRPRVLEYLETHKSYHVFVPAIIDGNDTLFRLRVVADEKMPGCFIIGLQNVDTEARDELRSKELIQKLAESYIIVDYIDFVQDTYRRYQNNSKRSIDHSFSGKFSELMSSYIYKSVYADDRDAMTAATNNEALREQLKTHKRISIRYRSVSSGEPRYYEMQFINIGDDAEVSSAILTLSDIDSIVQAEHRNEAMMNQAEKKLFSAETKTIKDALTGVKNITAYTDTIADLSALLKSNPSMNFGIVLCDIDNMKTVNETLGTEAGDMYIQNCCKLICDIFAHSPIYRIGGDEFVALLYGSDYDNMDELIKKLDAAESEAEKLLDFESGKASFSTGVAVYDRKKDSAAADVIRRAELEMLKKKKQNKKQ